MYQENKNPAKKIQVWTPLLLAMALVIGMLVGTRLQPTTSTIILENPKESASNGIGQGRIEELIRYIEAKYVDDVNRETLIEEAIDNILKNLDPHSNYIPAEQLKEVNEQLEGNFDGIGIEFMIMEDTIVVVSPLVGGPSEAVGVLAGDKIVAIEDSIIAGVNITSKGVMNLLRGEKGSEVEISILRDRKSEPMKFTIKRDRIPMNSVEVAYMIDEVTGYIKISRFSATTYDEFMRGLEELVEKKGMEDLIIDLRHNPGGYLQQATNILSQLFKEKDKLMVYTEGRTVNRNDYPTSGRAYYNVKDVAVLIDEGSASASEILAGALQDHDRGLIIGRRSFGKGLVQEQYSLRDGSALRLTVARYYTPSGRSIQKSYEDFEQYEQDVLDRYNSGELSSESQMAIIDSTEYYTSSGRVVYGGGGISPDIFVPIDTLMMNDEYLSLRQHIPQFAYRYIEANRQKFDYTLEQFANNYGVNTNVFKAFMAYAKDKGTEIDPLVLSEKNKRGLKRFMKARMAKHLYNDEAFFSVWNKNDEMIQKARTSLQSTVPITSK